MRTAKLTPTPLMTGLPPASRSMPEPSMPGWRAGSASTANSSSAGASIRLDTDTGRPFSALIADSFLLPGTAPGGSRVGLVPATLIIARPGVSHLTVGRGARRWADGIDPVQGTTAAEGAGHRGRARRRAGGGGRRGGQAISRGGHRQRLHVADQRDPDEGRVPAGAEPGGARGRGSAGRGRGRGEPRTRRGTS